MTIESLNDEQRKALKFELEKALYKKSFYEFVKAACIVLEPSTQWSWNWHIEFICDKLQAEILRIKNGLPKTKDLIITQPPRTMKSLILLLLPAWTWAMGFPECKFLRVSYSDALASHFSYQTRLLIQSDWYRAYFPEVKLAEDNNQKTFYVTTAGGHSAAFGLGASITGMGSDVILCDDLLRPTDISMAKLDSAIAGYRDVVYNRLNQPKTGLRVIVGQRVAEGDVIGYLKSNDPELYDEICLPMEMTKDVKPEFLISNYKDGLLWKERFPAEVLIPYKKNNFFWSAQYLENPVPLEGSMIKRDWLEIIDAPPNLNLESLRWEAILDSAYTANPDNDESAVLVCAKWNNYLLIKKVYILYLEFPELIRKLREIYKFDLYGKGIFRAEGKANGLSIIQTLSREGINITKTETPKDSKEIRVTSILNELESKRVKIIKGGGENLLIQQCVAFPHSTRDGLVDCLYYAVKHNLQTVRMKTRMIR